MLRMDVRRAEANLCLENFEEARKLGELAISHQLTAWPAFTVLTSTLGHLGDFSEMDTILENIEIGLGRNLKLITMDGL